MKQKNYSWKGSPNAGLVLALAAAAAGIIIVVAGFGG
jgi:hypothetical protein